MDERFVDIIEKYKDLSLINNYLELEYGNDNVYKVGLATGYPGISIMLYEAYKVTNNQEYYNTANVYLSETIKLISNEPMFSSSLFSGSFGVIFSLVYCSDNGKNYSGIVSSLLDQYDKIFEEHSYEVLNCIKKEVFDDYFYDVISGYSGILNTLLFTKDKFGEKIHPNLNMYINRSINILENIVSLAIHNDHFEEENILNNLGMAHGITGIINSLIASYNRGFDQQNKNVTLKDIKYFYLRNITKVNGIKRVPNFINKKMNHRDAWCYGSPGVSFCIQQLSILMKDESLHNISKELLNTTLQRSIDERGLISPTLCHGYAGMLIIGKQMNNEKIVEYYYQKIMESFNTDFEFAFTDVSIKNNKLLQTKSISLLEGSTGIILAILSLENMKSDAHKFMIFD